jgi:RNA polymerase sigma-70 factor (ECF subfamily)
MLSAAAHPFLSLQIAPRGWESLRCVQMTAFESNVAGEVQARDQARLLAAIARGEKEALAGLYDSLSRPLYSLAHRILSDEAEAEDVVQDVFLQIWRKAGTFDPARGSVFGWAATLTRNRAIDRVRMRKRRTELLADSASDLQPAPLSGDLDSSASLWLQEKARAVRSALGQLAPDQQKAIELAFFSGLTQLQISAKLNEPLGTIKARIRRGLLKLKENLSSLL